MENNNCLHSKQENLSYELYKELASEICAPINDKDMTLDLRYELYKSKLIYLYNIQEQCFRSINSSNEQTLFSYTQEDLVNIKNAIEVTKDFLKQTIRESMENSAKIAENKFLSKTR